MNDPQRDFARQRIIERAEKELAALATSADTYGAAGVGNGGCYPSERSLSGAVARECPSPAPASEVSGLTATILERTEVLHMELSRIEQRFSIVLRPSDPQNKTCALPPVLTSLGSRLSDVLQGVDAAIARLQSIQELACL